MARTRPVQLNVVDGKLVTSPNRVTASGGDTIVWNASGDLTISFPRDANPLVADGELKGPSGTITAVVRENVPDGHFECTITIGGKRFEHATGVDTPGIPPS